MQVRSILDETKKWLEEQHIHYNEKELSEEKAKLIMPLLHELDLSDSFSAKPPLDNYSQIIFDTAFQHAENTNQDFIAIVTDDEKPVAPILTIQSQHIAEYKQLIQDCISYLTPSPSLLADKLQTKLKTIPEIKSDSVAHDLTMPQLYEMTFTLLEIKYLATQYRVTTSHAGCPEPKENPEFKIKIFCEDPRELDPLTQDYVKRSHENWLRENNFLESAKADKSYRTRGETLLKKIFPLYINGIFPESLVFNTWNKIQYKFSERVLTHLLTMSKNICQSFQNAIIKFSLYIDKRPKHLEIFASNKYIDLLASYAPYTTVKGLQNYAFGMLWLLEKNILNDENLKLLTIIRETNDFCSYLVMGEKATSNPHFYNKFFNTIAQKIILEKSLISTMQTTLPNKIEFLQHDEFNYNPKYFENKKALQCFKIPSLLLKMYLATFKAANPFYREFANLGTLEYLDSLNKLPSQVELSVHQACAINDFLLNILNFKLHPDEKEKHVKIDTVFKSQATRIYKLLFKDLRLEFFPTDLYPLSIGRSMFHQPEKHQLLYTPYAIYHLITLDKVFATKLFNTLKHMNEKFNQCKFLKDNYPLHTPYLFVNLIVKHASSSSQNKLNLFAEGLFNLLVNQEHTKTNLTKLEREILNPSALMSQSKFKNNPEIKADSSLVELDNTFRK